MQGVLHSANGKIGDDKLLLLLDGMDDGISEGLSDGVMVEGNVELVVFSVISGNLMVVVGETVSVVAEFADGLMVSTTGSKGRVIIGHQRYTHSSF